MTSNRWALGPRIPRRAERTEKPLVKRPQPCGFPVAQLVRRITRHECPWRIDAKTDKGARQCGGAASVHAENQNGAPAHDVTLWGRWRLIMLQTATTLSP